MIQNKGLNRFVSALCSAIFSILLVTSLGLEKASAQVVYGSVLGTVVDPSGAVIPNATVLLSSKETGYTKTETSDAGGRYSFVNVPPGKYDVKITSAGFKSVLQSGVDVSPNTIGRVDATLEIGQVSDQVTVSATAAELQTDKADTHTSIESKEITSIPLGGYRSYQSLINLVPGATPAATQNSITDSPGRSLRTNINGGNAQTNITRIDGAVSVNLWLPHHVGYVEPSENVAEVNITTSAGDAEQGMAGASAVTVITKSGTNDIHATGFWFHDDQHLKARNFFQQVGTPKPLSIYNNTGGNIGGAIKKNKLFYFFNYDYTGQRQGSPGTYTVPTADQRKGIFPASPTASIYDPSTGNFDGTDRVLFVNNQIPTSKMDPIALKLQAYYPAANLAGTSNNYGASGGPILSRKFIDIKGDYHMSDSHSMFAKYGRMTATAGGQGVFGIAGGSGLGTADPGLGHTTIQLASLGHTWSLSPNLVLDGVLGYERQDQNVEGNDYGTNYGLQLGIPNTNGPDPRQSGFPNITITGYNGFGVPNWMPAFRVEESYTHSDNLTYTKGAHTLRFGFDMVRHHLNHWQPELSPGGPRGILDFNGGYTALAGTHVFDPVTGLPVIDPTTNKQKVTPGPAPNQYNAYAQFLLGASDEVQKGLQYILMTGREWQFGWYGQDRWQVSRKLTVTAGLRYELYPLMTRAGKGLERYDPSTNQVLLGGRGNVPDNAGISVSHTLFAPHAGIAYRLSEKTVIRTGYGMNFDPIPFSRPLRGFYPLTINADQVAPNGYQIATVQNPSGGTGQVPATFENGVPQVSGPDLSTGSVTLPGNATERSPNSYIHRGYVQSWNFTIEQKLPSNVLLGIGYVGQHSTHLLADYDINSGFPGSGTALLPYNVKYGRTVATSMWDGYLSSSYNSLQVAVNRSFSKGLLLKGAYTYSKAIDYTDDDGWASVGWNWAPVFQRNRAAAGFDRTHVLQMAWVYELPFGAGKMFAQSGILAKALGHWQVNGTMSNYTGTPFTVTAPGSSLNAPDNTQTANQIGPITRLGNVGPGTTYYTTTTSFAAVTAQNIFGNTGRNILRNPGMWNTDLDITREFLLKERLKLQFRGEFFNFPNTSHFGGVSSSSVTSGSFMQILTATGERQCRFGLRLQW